MGRTGKIQNVLRLMRPRHYIKNLLILVSVTFDRNLFRPAVLAQALLGFGAFCLLASAVYVLNDIRDVEADRQHEIKRARPIASGAVAIPEAWGLAALLLAASLAVQLAAFGNRGNSLLLMLAYFAVNLGYSLGLKHVPFLDIVLLVMGFVLRVVYGAAIVGSSTSAWVYLTVFALSFYLGLGKRRNELARLPQGAGPPAGCSSITPMSFWTSSCICASPWPSPFMPCGAPTRRSPPSTAPIS